jgi:hypothetical protein
VIRLIPRVLLCAAILVASTTFPTASFAGQANVGALRDDASYDRFIVRFAPATARADAAARVQVLDAAGRGQGVHFAQVRRLAVGSDVVMIDRKLGRAATQGLMQRLAHDPRVEYVEVDAVVRTLLTPNDPMYANGSQWNLLDSNAGGIRMPGAWDRSLGNGVVVAVLDTGLVPHIDLPTNPLPGYDFVSDAANARDNDGRDADPFDPGYYCAGQARWHGTLVTGVIAALINNNEGVAGIAPEAQVLPVRTVGQCGGTLSDLADAIVWARGGSVAGVPANPTPADVINISLGFNAACGTNSAVALAINGARAAGVVVVAAAGDDNVSASSVTPAGCAGVITVGGSNTLAEPAWWSNWGTAVDLAAPADNGSGGVLSTLSHEAYFSHKGTSIAAPQVAGVVALMQAWQPSTPDEVESILRASARAFAGPCPNSEANGICGGAGILDANAALTRLATPTLTFANVAVVEGNVGNRTATFTATLSKAAPWPVTARVTTNGLGASQGVDFVGLTAQTITIPAGQLTKTIDVSVVGDTTIENDETFQLAVTQVYGAYFTGTGPVGTITNDDVPQLFVDDLTVTEGTGGARSATFTVRLDRVAPWAVNYTVATADGTAVAPGDYTAVVATAQSIPAGQLSKTFAVALATDATLEPNETFSLQVANAAGASIADATGVATINNDEAPVLSIADVSVTEGNSGTKAATFTFTLSQPTTTAVTFNVATTAGTATAGSDFVAVATTPVTIAAGQTSKAFGVTVNGDTAVEASETFFLDVSSLVGATATDLQGQATISNDDLPTISVTDYSVVEGGPGGASVVTFKIYLSQPAPARVYYTVSTSGGTANGDVDFTVVDPLPLSFAAGQSMRLFSVDVIGDAAVEANETFFLNLTNVSNAIVADGQGQGTIINDDGPTLAVGDVTIAEGNAGTKTANFTVTLSQPVAVPVGFTLATANLGATAGSDYVAVPATARSIPAGQTSLTFPVTINGDTTFEADEVFALNLTNASNATILDSTGWATITNDDLPTLSINDVTVTEGNSGKKAMTFTISLSAATSTNVTFNAMTGSAGTAQSPVDFDPVATTLLTIPAGQTSVVYTVMVNGDTVVEPTESFGFNLSAASGATFADSQGIGTILNDD